MTVDHKTHHVSFKPFEFHEPEKETFGSKTFSGPSSWNLASRLAHIEGLRAQQHEAGLKIKAKIAKDTQRIQARFNQEKAALDTHQRHFEHNLQKMSEREDK